MAGYSEKLQTPARLASLAAEYRDFSEILSRAAEAMKALQIESAMMPRANAEEVGLKQTRTFAYTAQDFIRSVGHEINGGLSQEKAIQKVLSEYKNEKRKARENNGQRQTKKNKTDKTSQVVNPISKAS